MEDVSAPASSVYTTREDITCIAASRWGDARSTSEAELIAIAAATREDGMADEVIVARNAWMERMSATVQRSTDTAIAK